MESMIAKVRNSREMASWHARIGGRQPSDVADEEQTDGRVWSARNGLILGQGWIFITSSRLRGRSATAA